MKERILSSPVVMTDPDSMEVMRVSVQKDSDRVLLEILPDSMEAVADLAAEWVEDADAIRGFLSFCYDAPPETAAALRNPGGFS